MICKDCLEKIEIMKSEKKKFENDGNNKKMKMEIDVEEDNYDYETQKEIPQMPKR